MPTFLQDFIDQIGGLWPIVIGAIAIILAILLFRFGSWIRFLIREAAIWLKWFLYVLAYGFPPLQMAIGWMMPSLHTPVGWHLESATRGGLLILGGIGVVWLLFIQLMFASDPSTSLRELIADFMMSALWAVVFCSLAGYFFGTSELQWWLAVPTLLCIIDLFWGTIGGFRNAFQKNPTQLTKGSDVH